MSKIKFRGWGNSLVDGALALYVADQGSTTGIPCDSLIPTKSDPWTQSQE